MIAIPSFLPPIVQAERGLAVRGADASAAGTWFNSATLDKNLRISADLDPASRGLNVEQHAHRVLASLLATHADGG